MAAALKQIENKDYDTELVKRGVKKEDIHHYGFAFEGKRGFDRWTVDTLENEEFSGQNQNYSALFSGAKNLQIKTIYLQLPVLYQFQLEN